MSELSMLHPVFNNLPNEIKGLSTLSLKKARSLIVTWSPSNVKCKTHISDVTGGNFLALSITQVSAWTGLSFRTNPCHVQLVSHLNLNQV